MQFDGPQPEYLDGELVERRLGSTPHFRSLKQSHSLFGYPEVTLKVSPNRYRIADVAVFTGDVSAAVKYPVKPPVVVIEIVSEDDRHVEIQEKLAEYHAWGFRHIWLVDPWTRKLFVYDSAGLRELAELELPEAGARICADEIFG